MYNTTIDLVETKAEPLLEDSEREDRDEDTFAAAEAKIAGLEAQVEAERARVHQLQAQVQDERLRGERQLQEFKIRVGRRAVEEKENLGYCDELYSVLEDLGIDPEDLKTTARVTVSFRVSSFVAGRHSSDWWRSSIEYDYDEELTIRMDADHTRVDIDSVEIENVEIIE